jgi:hypothetical protein
MPSVGRIYFYCYLIIAAAWTANDLASDNLVRLLTFPSPRSPFVQSPVLSVFNPALTSIALSMNHRSLAQPTRKEEHPFLSVIDLSFPGRPRRFVPSPSAPDIRTRHNREGTIFGNNAVGRKGKPRCDNCRKRKSRVPKGIYIYWQTDRSASMLQPNRPANSVFPVDRRNPVLKDWVQKQRLSGHCRHQFLTTTHRLLRKMLLG